MGDGRVFEPPPTQYAKAGDFHIAYQVVGEGPIDVMFVPGLVSNIELAWEEPLQSSFLKGLASFSRLILFDKRGTGLSDPVPVDRPPTLEDRMADIDAVLDAVGSERVSLFSLSEGGSTSALFGATHPDRTTSLVLWGATPRIAWAEDWPWGTTREQGIAQLKSLEAGNFGEYFGVDFFVPSVAGDAQFERWWSRASRLGASPGMWISLLKTNGATDVRDVLPTITVPTLVIHREGDQVVDVRSSEYMAAQIPGAKLVVLPGGDHWPWVGDADSVLDEVQQFLVGTRPKARVDRFLTTVLFTDIVDSTVKAADVGDSAWSKLLTVHDEFSKDELGRFGGEWIKGTGDGMLAIFDGPGRAIMCARSLLNRAQESGIHLRAGLHTGEAERRGQDVAGMAVHIAARLSALAAPDEVVVTSTVRDLVAGSGLEFEDRAKTELKGVPGEWELLSVVNPEG
jgi:pimeloyl-ACP methyl ester carboxylesterase